MTTQTENPTEINLRQKALNSLVLLISRSGYIQAISYVGFFILSILLTPAQFGVFFVVNEIVGILGYFSDVGLAASLIQSKHKPTIPALRTSFTIQQLLVLSLSIIVLFLSPWIQGVYQLSQSGLYLVWAVVAAFILASLKTIPSVILERELDFHKLVIVETIENIVFYLIAVIFAAQGYGVTSYTVAVLARGIIGTSLIYILAPWQFGLAWDIQAIKDLFKFGIPYQANTFIAVLKDRFLNLFLGAYIGTTGMGIIGWAQSQSQKPLRFVSDNVTKVTFPAFARIQHQPERLARSIDKMLFFTGIIIFPLLVGMGTMIDWFITLVPNYQKWQPALIPFYFYLFNSAWSAISLPITNTLAAVGKIKTVSKLMVMWTILTWGIVAPAGYLYGYTGVAAAMAFISTFSLVPIYLLRRHIPFNPLVELSPSLIASLFMATAILYAKTFIAPTWVSFIGLSLAGGVIFIIVIYALAHQKLTQYGSQILISYKDSKPLTIIQRVIGVDMSKKVDE